MQGMQNKNVRYLITNGEPFNMNSKFIKNGYFQVKLSLMIYFLSNSNSSVHLQNNFI